MLNLILKILFLPILFLSINCFAYDENKCIKSLLNIDAPTNFASKGVVLNGLVSKIANQAKIENYFKESDLLSPLSMTATESVLVSVSINQFQYLTKLKFFSTNVDEYKSIQKIIINSYGIFNKNNDIFLSILNYRIDSTSSQKIRVFLEEARTTIFEINYLLDSCKD